MLLERDGFEFGTKRSEKSRWRCVFRVEKNIKNFHKTINTRIFHDKFQNSLYISYTRYMYQENLQGSENHQNQYLAM